MSVLAIFCALTASAQTGDVFLIFTNADGSVVSSARFVRLQGERVIYRVGETSGGTTYATNLSPYFQRKIGYVPESLVQSNILAFPMKQSPIWQPTPDQAKLQGSRFFKTDIDEFDRMISHELYNFDDLNELHFCTAVYREYVSGSATSTYKIIFMLTQQPDGISYHFDTAKPLELMVDGEKYSIKDDGALATNEVNWRSLTWNEFYASHSYEQMLRALGGARRAAVRIPCRSGNFTHQYSKLELDRFAIFSRVFLPELVPDLNSIQLDKKER
jgi:hypothetical protein